MSELDRQQRLDAIRKYSDKLTDLARAYDRLRWMAEQPGRTDAFMTLAEAAGALTIDGLAQTATVLEILMRSEKEGGEYGWE